MSEIETIGNKQISDYRTVLVAPTSYFSGCIKGFDARINYEDIFEWYTSDTSMGNRKQYKLSLLHSAIEKSTFGYQTVADAVVTEFWHSYWKLAQQIAPEFEMPEPSSKPAGSSFSEISDLIYLPFQNTHTGSASAIYLPPGSFLFSPCSRTDKSLDITPRSLPAPLAF